MLEKILEPEKCADCRNCCVFYEKSRWEMPMVSERKAELIRRFLNDDNAVSHQAEGFGYRLKSVHRDRRPSETSEEYRCAALDEDKGCTLPPELKPIECSLWPIRIMNDHGRIYITLAPSCHAVDTAFRIKAVELLNGSLKKELIDLINSGKHIIRPFEPSYERLFEITKDITENE